MYTSISVLEVSLFRTVNCLEGRKRKKKKKRETGFHADAGKVSIRKGQ